MMPESHTKTWTRIALLCCALPACGDLEPDPQAGAAAQWALERGGAVRVFNVPGEITNPAELPSGEFAVEEINMNQLGIEQAPITDKDLEVLKDLNNIRVLGLYGSSVTDEGCKLIATLKTLRELELSQAPITDAGLEELAALPNLEKLFIRNVGSGVTDDGLANFKRRSGARVFR